MNEVNEIVQNQIREAKRIALDNFNSGRTQFDFSLTPAKVAAVLANRLKEMHDELIPSEDRANIKHLQSVFDVIILSKRFKDVELLIGSKLFFDEFYFYLDDFYVVVKTKEVTKYPILNDARWREWDYHERLKVLEFYDELVDKNEWDITFEQLKEKYEFENNLKLQDITPANLDVLDLSYDAIDTEIFEYKSTDIKEIEHGPKVAGETDSIEMSKEAAEFFEKNREFFQKNSKKTAGILKLYEELCKEGADYVPVEDINMLYDNHKKVEDIIKKYSLIIDDTSDKRYKPTLTRVALAKGFCGLSNNEDGVYRNDSSKDSYFFGNETRAHGQFDGILKSGHTTPRGVDVDFVYWGDGILKKEFYKVLPDKLYSSKDPKRKIIPVTRMTDAGVSLPNYLSKDTNFINSALKDELVEKNGLTDRLEKVKPPPPSKGKKRKRRK